MERSDISSYSEASSFVEKYALNGNGLDDELVASEVVDSPEMVVLLDALLRKHYTVLSVEGLSEGTGLREDVVRGCLEDLQDAGLVVSESGKYRINKDDERVGELRDIQTGLLTE